MKTQERVTLIREIGASSRGYRDVTAPGEPDLPRQVSAVLESYGFELWAVQFAVTVEITEHSRYRETPHYTEVAITGVDVSVVDYDDRSTPLDAAGADILIQHWWGWIESTTLACSA